MENVRFKSLAMVLRTYNNNPTTVKAVQRALRNGIGHIVVIVNADVEADRGNVRAWLAGLMEQHPTRLSLVEMNEGYTWSNALNQGIEVIRALNYRARFLGQPQFQFILNCSNEVLWEDEHLEALLAKTTKEGYDIVGAKLIGRDQGTVVELGVSYIHPRNTFMIVRVGLFAEIGHFDSMCDGFLGMEDFQFCLRAELLGFTVCADATEVVAHVGVYKPQEKKERNERNAMRRIVTQLRTLYRDVPEVLSTLEVILDRYEATDLGPIEEDPS